MDPNKPTTSGNRLLTNNPNNNSRLTRTVSMTKERRVVFTSFNDGRNVQLRNNQQKRTEIIREKRQEDKLKTMAKRQQITQDMTDQEMEDAIFKAFAVQEEMTYNEVYIAIKRPSDKKRFFEIFHENTELKNMKKRTGTYSLKSEYIPKNNNATTNNTTNTTKTKRTSSTIRPNNKVTKTKRASSTIRPNNKNKKKELESQMEVE
jgi:hypothetical protein